MVQSSGRGVLESFPDLANAFQGSMIRLPYRHRIIPLYLLSVQILNSLVYSRGNYWLKARFAGQKSYFTTTTAHISYFVVGAVLISYYISPTLLKSYLPFQVIGFQFREIIGIVLLPLLGLATKKGTPETTLGDFEESQPDKDDEDGEDPGESTERSIESENKSRKPAYGYARQSQTQGKDRDDDGDTASIKTQKRNILQTADERDLGPVRIFSDLNESGFSFDREGLNELKSHLEQDPRPLILDRINRLGRETLETIHVAAELHYKYDIPIITHRYGEYELSSHVDQSFIAIKSIAAGESVQDRMRSTWDTIKHRFKEEGIWKTWFSNVRLGYRIPEDESWPEPAPGGALVISAIMQDMIEVQDYEAVARLLRNRVNNQTLDTKSQRGLKIPELDSSTVQSVLDHSDLDLDTIDGSKIKTIVTDAIYIGDIEYPRFAEPKQRSVIEDEDLQLIDEELFQEANDVVAEISNVNSNTDDSIDTEELAELGLLLKTTQDVDAFKPVCSRCGRGMVKNGTDPLNDNRKAHYWICPNYRKKQEDESAGENSDGGDQPHSQIKFPKNEEWKALKDHLENDYEDASDIVILRVCPFEETS